MRRRRPMPDGGRRPAALVGLLWATGLVSGCASASIQDQVATLVPDDVTVEVTESTYAVFGRTVGDIWNSMNQRGPAVNNRIVGGVHNWGISWNMQPTRSDAGCQIGELDIQMRTEITMPVWRQRAGADVELQEAWDEFELLLREHEEQHRTYALEAVRDLQRTIRAERAPDCETLQRRIRAQTDVIMDRYNAVNVAFDQRELLTWPPRR